MKQKLRDFLQMEEFDGFDVISGAQGLDREVETVSVMDAPDIYKWLRGGEILLTTGYIFKDNPEGIGSLIKKINKVNAAALFIKMGRFIECIPKEVLEISEQLRFPIVSMPFDLAFIDVINPVLSRIVQAQSRILEHSVKTRKVFADMLLQGEGIKAMVGALQDLIDRAVIFYDSMFKRTFGAGGQTLWEDFEECLLAEYTCYRIESDNVLYGYFVILEKGIEINEYEKITLEHAAVNIMLLMQKRISNLQLEKRYKDQFVQDIIFNNLKSKEEMVRRGRMYGWDFLGQYCSFIIKVDDIHQKYEDLEFEEKSESIIEVLEKVFKEIIALFKANDMTIMYTSFSDHIVILMSELDNVTYKRMENCLKNIHKRIAQEYGYTVTIAVGEKKKSMMNITKSYDEAKRTMKIAELIHTQDATVRYEELGVYRFLDQVKTSAGVPDFYMKNLKELIEYDQKNDGELMSTLSSVIDCNWNLKDTAEKTYLHYNTIKYRYKKIQEILSVDLSKTSEKLNMELSVRLYQMLEL